MRVGVFGNSWKDGLEGNGGEKLIPLDVRLTHDYLEYHYAILTLKRYMTSTDIENHSPISRSGQKAHRFTQRLG